VQLATRNKMTPVPSSATNSGCPGRHGGTLLDAVPDIDVIGRRTSMAPSAGPNRTTRCRGHRLEICGPSPGFR